MLLFSLRENYGLSEVHTDRLPMPRSYSGVGLTDWNEALDIIEYGSPEQVCSKFLCKKSFRIMRSKWSYDLLGIGNDLTTCQLSWIMGSKIPVFTAPVLGCLCVCLFISVGDCGMSDCVL